MRENRAPFLAQKPGIGYIIFSISVLLFGFLALQVMRASPTLVHWDTAVATSIHTWAIHQSQVWVLPMRALSALGRDGIALLILILTVVWLRQKRGRELALMWIGVGGGEIWFQLLSNLIGRQRPGFKDAFETLLGPGFPSGHMTTAVLLAWMIGIVLAPRLKSPGSWVRFYLVSIILIAAIGFSRLFLGLHYPSDLLGGVLLGLAWGGLAYTSIELFFWKRQAVWHQLTS
jgi:membrane-associated phospholipid phosphatase